MKNLLSKKALTLTELLIASVLMGIVMLGIAGFSASLTNIYKTTSGGNHLATRTLATMKLITRDISRAVGKNDDRGIINFTGLGNEHSLCLRHDVANTPDDYLDDVWTCYFADSATGNLTRCVNPTVAPAVTTLIECTTGASNVISNIVEINTAAVPGGTIFSNIVNDTGRLASVEIILSTSQVGNQACDPVDNLCYYLQTNVSPISHSRN